MQTDQFLSQLIQLSQLRLKREQPRQAPPKQPERYAYATAAKGYGYRMALMGFDFTDLEEKRRKFQWWLESQGVDSDTAYDLVTKLNHSWDFATCGPRAGVGKDFLNSLDPWLGALDMTPGSVGLRLYDKYREVRGRNIFLSTDTTYNVHRTVENFEMSEAARRCDFAAIEKCYTQDAVSLDRELRGFIAHARDSLIQLIEKQNVGELTAGFAQSLQVTTGPEFAQTVERTLIDIWRKNRDGALDELPDNLQNKLRGLRQFATPFQPDIAGNYFHNRALAIRGLVDDELTKQAKFAIFQTLKNGSGISETIGRLRDIFEPWVGDPSKVEPSGITDTPEDILRAPRLENISRTEISDAITRGRMAVADAARDFIVGIELSPILDFRTTPT